MVEASECEEEVLELIISCMLLLNLVGISDKWYVLDVIAPLLFLFWDS